jgi:hypothetical protein
VNARPEAGGTAQDLVPGIDYPRSLPEFMAMFRDEAECARFVERLRFVDGFACRDCGVLGEPWRASQGRLMCKSCRAVTRLRAGTVFDKTRTPLTTWFAAAWYLTTAKNGLSAVTLERTLGVVLQGRVDDAAALPRGDGPRGAAAAVG